MSAKAILVCVLMSVGTAIALHNLASAANAPVAATPLEAAIAPDHFGMAEPAAYLALAKFHFLRNDPHSSEAAAFNYLSFFLISTKATGRQCARHGVDASAALYRFAASHAANYRRASLQLVDAGLNSARIWQMLDGALEQVAEQRLSQIATRFGTDDADACRRLVAGHAYSGTNGPTDSVRLLKLMAGTPD